ncbi:hypothetical protein [Pedobacter namyangjuensis]|uniref:hypothetical protein n=1 Tax=Pedobacter namyangjuensis TaxID=600626 RepID=UPI000DE2929C|nr:hypothetical protein [Pedobacter namyangjuensis]
MKKIFLTLLLFATANVAFAQQKYYPFSINGKHGITDNLGNEVMKPTYAFATEIPAKGQIYLQDFSDRPDIIFNNKTGAKQLYERILNNQVQIKDVGYSVITNKGKKYLLSEENEKTIPITRDYDDFKTIGQVIIADYDAQDPYVSGGKDKNGIPLPPKIRGMKKHYVVLANDLSLKTIVDKGFNKYLPLYKVDEDEEDKGIVRMVTVKLEDFNKKPNFDYIILSQGNNHKLYNDKMVLVKAFVLAKADEDMLLDFCEKTLKQNLSTTSENSVGGTVSAPPMMVGPSMGKSKNPTAEPEEKRPFKPYFFTKKIENGNTIFALQETEEISKRIFEAKPTSTVKFYKSDNYINIKIAGKEDSRFYFDRKTGEIFLPKAYLTGLGITLI